MKNINSKTNRCTTCPFLANCPLKKANSPLEDLAMPLLETFGLAVESAVCLSALDRLSLVTVSLN